MVGKFCAFLTNFTEGCRYTSDVHRILSFFFIFFVLFVAGAQERHNYLAVNGALIDDAGPYYFIQEGDSTNAFVKAAPIARALGLDLTFNSLTKELVFTQNGTTLTVQTTENRNAVSERTPDAFTLRRPGGNPTTISAPKGIIVDGTGYVALTPLVIAIGGESEWHPNERLITVFAEPEEVLPRVTPRNGFTDGVSRIAIDIPAGGKWQFGADEHTLLISISGVNADEQQWTVQDGNVDRYAIRGEQGQVSLVVETAHRLDPSGAGYQIGELPREDGMTVVYVDFAPNLQGQPVTALRNPTSTPQEPAPTTNAEPLPPLEQKQVVVLDFGHGGHDPGARSSWAVEKDVVLSVGLLVRDKLEAAGMHVILTRDDDFFLTLQERSEFATSDRNLFVSIHANSAENASAHGIETWVFGEPLDPSLIERAITENGGGAEGQALTEEARRAAASFAADILREAQLNYSLALAEAVQGSLINQTGAIDRGVRANLLYVIRNARIPAILVEIGFVSNQNEGSKLATRSYQEQIAEGISRGIIEFLTVGGMLSGG